MLSGLALLLAALTIAGTVEDAGLRRTTIRAPDGTVHSISNAEMRRVSNRTRIYSAAEVRVRGIREEDLEEMLDTMNRIGDELEQGVEPNERGVAPRVTRTGNQATPHDVPEPGEGDE